MQPYTKYCREDYGPHGELLNFQLDYPEDFNFGYDVVDLLAREEPDKRAMVWCSVEGRERIFTFRDMSRLSNQAANLFRTKGIGRGDQVMVALKRHYEYWIVTVALHKLGAILIPMTHMLTVEDIRYRMGRTRLKAIVCTPQDGLPDRVREAAEAEGLSCPMWTLQETCPGFGSLTQEMAAMPDTLDRQPTLAHDPMVLYFTSGTTGYPKGVVHDFSYPLAHIVTARDWQQVQEDGLHFTVAETGWAKASWGKLYGQWLLGCAVMVYDFDNFDPKQLTAVINHYGVTSFCAPPTVYRYLVKKGVPAMPSLRHAATAGEKLHPEVFRRFREKTGLPLAEGYGQTETTLLLANFKGREPVEGSMGTPSPLYHIALLGADGKPVPDGEIGEIVLLTPESGKQAGLFAGYLGTDGPVWQGGVYHTGDAAWKDSEGNYWFHGRFDDIIKTGGFRVGPFEVENVLMEHPAVLECSVVGIPDPLRGQAIRAVILPAAGWEPTKALEQELKEFANSRMAEYKWVRSIQFVSAMPKTISGKIRKQALREGAAG